MTYKKLVPCIYLYRGNAVADADNRTVIDLNPIELALFYSRNHADELLIFDLSETEKEHQEALDLIKDICAKTDIPVIGAGNVQRMEDIKKLLYAGCKKAALNYSLASNVAITAEVSLKFGRGKIVACVSSAAEITSHVSLLEEYVEEVIVTAERIIREAASVSQRPLLVSVPRVSLDKIIELLSDPVIIGITGNGINNNAKELLKIKDLCKENGIMIHSLEPAMDWAELKKNQEGMVPVVVQDDRTAEVLMVAYMNEAAYMATLQSGKMTYYSRSRNELWVKGDTSGHYQYVKSLTADCDKDTILAKVLQVGAACHTGSHSCFFHDIIKPEAGTDANPFTVLDRVLAVIKDRLVNPKEGSYTNYLFDKGLDKILKKMGEEAAEIIIASKNPNPNEIKYEIADFLYHMMVLMVDKGISWEEIIEELAKR